MAKATFSISLVIAVAAASLFATPSAGSSSPAFAGLQGAWSGSGNIALSDGSRERIRCKASYRTSDGGARMQQSLRCASDSYRFDLNSDLESSSGAITGSWSETSRGVSGSIRGREAGVKISAIADAPGFSANLSVSTRGNHQSFVLSSEGDIKSVSLQMTRQ